MKTKMENIFGKQIKKTEKPAVTSGRGGKKKRKEDEERQKILQLISTTMHECIGSLTQHTINVKTVSPVSQFIYYLLSIFKEGSILEREMEILSTKHLFPLLFQPIHSYCPHPYLGRRKGMRNMGDGGLVRIDELGLFSADLANGSAA